MENLTIYEQAFKMFKDGGWAMWPLLVCLIAGLVISARRFWRIAKASTSKNDFPASVLSHLKKQKFGPALELCEGANGPIASIFYAGLCKFHRGIEHVEKAITNAGSVEMAFLDKGASGLSTIISVAPMIGFLGTVWGMIKSFQEIALIGDVSPTIVAEGISIALLTTLFGLVVAIITQLSNNYLTSRVDEIIVEMEESSVELVDILVEMEKKNPVPNEKLAA